MTFVHLYSDYKNYFEFANSKFLKNFAEISINKIDNNSIKNIN